MSYSFGRLFLTFPNGGTASGLLGSQVQREFEIDGWESIGTGLSRISPPEIVKLDILDTKNIEQVLDEVKYVPAIFENPE